MIHGQRVRLHRNTVCHLEAPGRDFDGELCQVQSYDAAKNKWHIELNGGRHKGKELLVPESSLSFAYCLLAESIGQHKKMVKLIEEGFASLGEPVYPPARPSGEASSMPRQTDRRRRRIVSNA